MNDEYILRHFGGIHQNSLKYIMTDDEHNPADHDVLDIITHSPYTDEEKLTADLTINRMILQYSAQTANVFLQK